MPHKRISPTFLGPVSSAPSRGDMVPAKKKKSAEEKLRKKSAKRKQKLDTMLSQYGSAPAVPESAFRANREKGHRQFKSEQEVLAHFAKLEAQQLAAEQAALQQNKKKKMKATKRFGTTPIPPPPTGKTGVRGHWRKKP